MGKLEELNQAEEHKAVVLLEPMIERAPNVAQRVVKHRPFKSATELKEAIRKELLCLDDEERIQLFCSHPELAPVNPLSMTNASQSEQGRLKLTSDENKFKAQLDELNARYRDKFGFPFITALVRHDSMDSVFAEFETRLLSDRESEMEQALEQVATVSASRVSAAFECDSSYSTNDSGGIATPVQIS